MLTVVYIMMMLLMIVNRFFIIAVVVNHWCGHDSRAVDINGSVIAEEILMIGSSSMLSAIFFWHPAPCL